MTYRTGDSPNLERYDLPLSFTCIAVANQFGSDSPPVPVPVHIQCAYPETRIKDARKFVVDGKWVTSLPYGTKCHICGEAI